jgi:hypothetical protein
MYFKLLCKDHIYKDLKKIKLKFLTKSVKNFSVIHFSK